MNTGAARARMTMRALLQRNMALPENGGTLDVLNQAGPPDWEAVLFEQYTDGVEGTIPCWLRTDSGSVAVSASEFVTVERLNVMIPLGLGVRKEDRIEWIHDRQQAEILAGPFRIVALLPHHDHQEAQLERVH